MNLFDAYPQLDLTYFLYIGVFVGVLITFEGLRSYLMKSHSPAAVQAQRLKKLRYNMTDENAQQLINRPTKNSRLEKLPLYGQVPARMLQAGMTMKPSMFLSLCAIISFIVMIVVTLGTQPGLGLAAALLTGIVIPMSAINIVRKKRVELFASQLPDALDLMKRGLRVGHPLNVTISNVANSMQDPISSEFRIMSHQITYGDTLIDAVTDLANRVDQEDMHYLSASISIQHGTGGNLAGMLGTLATVIRQRYAMRRKIKAISSEGRISAWVLSSLPFVMYGGTTLTAPDYYSSVQDDPLYLPIALAVVGLVVANFVALRGLVNFRI